MRLKLDDNERGAFHYLIGGTLLVLLLRGGAWLYDAASPALTPDGQALALFQHGYPHLRGTLAVADTASSLGERIAQAVVFSVSLAFVLALAINLAARFIHRRAGRIGAWAVRLTLLAAAAWSLWCAFMTPLREARMDQGTLVLRQWKPILGDLPIPFSMQEQKLGRGQVDRIEAVEQAPQEGCDGHVDLMLVSAGGRQRIARAGGICDPERMDRFRAGSDAAALLERELR